MVRYLLDSNIVFAMFMDRNDVTGIRRKISDRIDECAISEITLAETYTGCYMKGSGDTSPEAEFLKMNFNVIQVSSADGRVLKAFGREKAALARQGAKIPDLDVLIACTALENGLICVTHDREHFSRIRGLETEDWL